MLLDCCQYRVYLDNVNICPFYDNRIIGVAVANLPSASEVVGLIPTNVCPFCWLVSETNWRFHPFEDFRWFSSHKKTLFLSSPLFNTLQKETFLVCKFYTDFWCWMYLHSFFNLYIASIFKIVTYELIKNCINLLKTSLLIKDINLKLYIKYICFN